MIDLEFHPEMFLVLPSLAITKGDCNDPECRGIHWRITLGWTVGSIHFLF